MEASFGAEWICCRCALLVQIWPTTGNGQILPSATMWGPWWYLNIIHEYVSQLTVYQILSAGGTGEMLVEGARQKAGNYSSLSTTLKGSSFPTQPTIFTFFASIRMELFRWGMLLASWGRGWRRLFWRSMSRGRRLTGWGWLLQESLNYILKLYWSLKTGLIVFVAGNVEFYSQIISKLKCRLDCFLLQEKRLRWSLLRQGLTWGRKGRLVGRAGLILVSLRLSFTTRLAILQEGRWR